MKFESLNKLYNLSGINISFIHIKYKPIGEIAKLLKKLRNEINQKYNNDERLLEIYNGFYRIFLKLLRTLLPYRNVFNKNVEEEIKKDLFFLKMNYPTLFSNIAVDIAKLFFEFTSDHTNKMTEFLVSHIKRFEKIDQKIAIITKRAFYPEEKEMLKSEFKNVFQLNFYTENGFRKIVDYYDEIIYLGNPNYFSEYVKNTFKGKNIYFASYDIFNNFLLKENFFKDISNQNVFSTLFNHVTIGEELKKNISFEINDIEHINYSINKLITNEKNQEIASQDLIDSKLIHLENDRIIFVGINSKIRVFTPDEDEIIKEIYINNLEEDEILIIRNGSDSKLVAEIADQDVLKENAKTYRKLQNMWKKRLKNFILKNGLKNSIRIFKHKYDITTATEITIKNWCSEDSICPQELKKILKALEFNSTEINEIYSAMRKIISAHIKAGRIISSKLMNELSNFNLEEFEERGSYTFESEELNGASFNLERVIKIETKNYKVPQHYLMKPYSIE